MKNNIFLFSIIFMAFALGVLSPRILNAQISYNKLFAHQQQLNFQEKLYLHTDKDSYMAGETVWLRIHRTDAMMHLPHLYSGMVYIDMYNLQDSLVSRIKIAKTDSCFQSSIRLNSALPAGDYFLIAYSNWMRNFDNAFFTKKKIHVVNSGPLKVNYNVRFRQENDICYADYNFLDNEGKPFPGLVLKYITKAGSKMVKQGIVNVEKNGDASIPVTVQDSVTSISIEFYEGKPMEFEAVTIVPLFEDDFDLQFMPEGGYWLAGVQQKMAFKAVGENGIGESVSGKVVDGKGNVITTFESMHKGMGYFSIKGEAGINYKAQVKTKGGLEKEFPLPDLVSEGVTLQTMDFRGAIRCAVQATPGFQFKEGMTLIVHSRGRLLSAMPVKGPVVSEVPAKILPRGIVHFALVDTGNVYCERLAFSGLAQENHLEATTDKTHYDRREKVTVNFSMPAGVGGDFSISVTDSKKVYKDTAADNIISYFMLSSDIAGNIEDPAWYFDEKVDLVTRNTNLDILMMTQAWRRFDIRMLCKGHTLPLDNFLELQQSISGKVMNVFGKPSVNATIAVVGITAKIFRFVQTDSTGHFEVNNLSFPEGTTLVIQGNKGKSNFINIEMDKETFPGIPYAMSPRKKVEDIENDAMDDFYKNLKLDYYYEDGVKVYLLEEFDVVAEKEGGDLIDEIYKDASDYRATTEDLEKGGYSTVFDWLSNVPGVYVTGESVKIRGKSPKIFVDDVPRTMEDFKTLSVADIASIGVIKDIEGMVAIGEATTGADAGAIVVRMKNGLTLGSTNKETSNFFKINPLGYHKADKFYEPKYETAEQLKNPEVDERTTIYWNPRVLIGKDGKASVSFYTADIPSDYRVVAEGVAANGEILRREFMIDRK